MSATQTTAAEIARVQDKLAKLAALADHPNTPVHESDAAVEAWLRLARKLRGLEAELAAEWAAIDAEWAANAKVAL